jgi:electron transfer flavoprotein alpha subunit
METGAVWAVFESESGPLSEMTASLLAEAARLADQLGAEAVAVVLGPCDEQLVGALGSRGAARVFVVHIPGASPYHADPYVPALTDLIRRHLPGVVLCQATALGRELTPRVAACLETGLASDCLAVGVRAGSTLDMSRAVYGGKASCTVVCPQARPQMLTLKQERSAAAAYVASPRAPEVIRLESVHKASAARTKLMGVFQEDPSSMDLAEADVIVAGGRGVGSREGFHLLVEMARLLGGAVAASRVAVDSGWVPCHRQVGQSGRTVAPSLYIACGISGAPHHLVGMRESRTVVAVNTDRNAPIFGLADLGIVGDLHEVLPAVVARLREARKGDPPSAAAALDALTQL